MNMNVIDNEALARCNVETSTNPINSDASELCLARLSSDLARARGLSARLSSAWAIFEPARVQKIQLGVSSGLENPARLIKNG